MLHVFVIFLDIIILCLSVVYYFSKHSFSLFIQILLIVPVVAIHGKPIPSQEKILLYSDSTLQYCYCHTLCGLLFH